MEDNTKKSLGNAIDEIIASLDKLDEPSRIIAIRAACDFLKIKIPTEAVISDNYPHKKQELLSDVNKPIYQVIDIKTLKEDKMPGTAIEMACIVAFYLEHSSFESEKKDNITTKDIEKYFKQAGYRLPKVPNQVLVDAKAAGYFDSAGKGFYKLNPVGYNLVAHKLPKKK